VPENILDVTPPTQPGGAGGNNNKPPTPKPAGGNEDGSRPNEPNASNKPGGDTGKSLPLASSDHAPVIGKANTKAEETVTPIQQEQDAEEEKRKSRAEFRRFMETVL
jgi:hypothetical protein